MIPATPLPDFRSPDFLRAHVGDTLAFYLPRAIDPAGGLFHFLLDDGSVYDAHTRHLVSSTRYVVTLSMAVRGGLGGDVARQALQAAFDFLPHHHNEATGGHAWLLDWRDGQARVLDGTNHAYGLAFVLLAHAHAHMAGLSGAHAGIAQTFELLEQRFWSPNTACTPTKPPPTGNCCPTGARTPTCTCAKPYSPRSTPPARPATSSAPRCGRAHHRAPGRAGGWAWCGSTTAPTGRWTGTTTRTTRPTSSAPGVSSPAT